MRGEWIEKTCFYIVSAYSSKKFWSICGIATSITDSYNTYRSRRFFYDINVAAGTYRENLTWENKDLVIQGAGADATTIDGSCSDIVIRT